VSAPPLIDDEARARLIRRFGPEVAAWLDELPDLLSTLAQRWQLEFGPLIPRGSMSVVIRCRVRDGRPAVLKASPDRTRLANEASALTSWTTGHTPAVLEVDGGAGAVLLEAIEPGSALAHTSTYPPPESVAELLASLHATGEPDPSYPPLADRVADLFLSGTRPYARRPELVDVVPPELYECGRELATRLADEVSPGALLHGDLTPRNILDGGSRRGLVAIDPAPCLGDDLAFDAVDLLLWQATDVDVVAARAEELAQIIGLNARRLLDWCVAFAGMVALELAEAPESPGRQIEAAVTLANQARRS
jgi:streptomycin 6-kinase